VNITFSGSGANRTVTVAPAVGQSGTVNITVSVSDGATTTSTSFTLTVNAAPNTPPSLSTIANRTINEDANTGAVAFTVGDAESATASLTVSGSSSNATIVPNANIVFGGSGANRTVTVTPAATRTGTATITLTVSDGTLTASTAFTLTVSAAANTAPTITAIAPQAINGNTSTGALAFTVGDAQTAAASLTVTRTSSNLTLVPTANVVLGGSGANRTVTVTPATNQFGTATITVTVSDGSLTASSAFLLTVNQVNTPPTITPLGSQATAVGIAVGPLAVTVGDLETATASLTLTGTSSNQALLPDANIALGGSGANRTVTLTPAAGQTGSATVTLTVGDGALFTAASFVLTVSTAPTGGLVAAYSFNEGAGTTVADATGIGNTGTISGATWNTTGKFGGSLTFNGTSNLVLINSSASLNFSSAMTLEAWVYPTATQSGWRTVVQKQTDAFLLHASSNSPLSPAGGGTFNGTVSFVSNPSAIALNTWTHLAVTYDGATIRLYVNGLLTASQAQTGALETNANAIRIGGNVPYGEYFLGRIDEVRIYNRALSLAELQTDMALPVTP
jgi:hypothetical protein